MRPSENRKRLYRGILCSSLRECRCYGGGRLKLSFQTAFVVHGGLRRYRCYEKSNNSRCACSLVTRTSVSPSAKVMCSFCPCFKTSALRMTCPRVFLTTENPRSRICCGDTASSRAVWEFRLWRRWARSWRKVCDKVV